MAQLTRQDREEIAEKRLLSVLGRHGIATSRTLEQKISDAGPNWQRIDPHILTPVRNAMVKSGVLAKKHEWFSLAAADPQFVGARYAAQAPVLKAFTHGALTKRTGQVLEIATFRALIASGVDFLGGFNDLDDHDDSTLYSKDEPPPRISGRRIPGDARLDFLVQVSGAGWLGIECKNIREWLYPDATEVREAIQKCLHLNCVPVIIARRIHFATFRLLSSCGVITHEVYNQLLPESAKDSADSARDKNLLGYHDIRTGNTPDARLSTFVTQNLARIAPGARVRFEAARPVLETYVAGGMSDDDLTNAVKALERNASSDADPPF